MTRPLSVFSSLKASDMHKIFFERTPVFGEDCTDGDQDGRDAFYFTSLYISSLNPVDVWPVKESKY